VQILGAGLILVSVGLMRIKSSKDLEIKREKLIFTETDNGQAKLTPDKPLIRKAA